MGNTPAPAPEDRRNWQFCVGLGRETPKRRLDPKEVPPDIKPGHDGRFLAG